MIKLKRNTQAIVRLAAEKSRQARRRVIETIAEMQREGAAINFNAICLAARVSKTFLYDPKHSDLAQQIRSLRQLNPQSATSRPIKSKKTDSAKDAQIVRFKERIRALEEQVRLPRRKRTSLRQTDQNQGRVRIKGYCPSSAIIYVARTRASESCFPSRSVQAHRGPKPAAGEDPDEPAAANVSCSPVRLRASTGFSPA